MTTWPVVQFDGLGPMPLDEAAAILRKTPMHDGDWTRTITATHAEACVCCYRHTPAVLEPQDHHLWPKYLGGPEHPDTLLRLCATTHTNAHRILRAMVKAGQLMPRELGQPRYSYHVASLGFQAWDAAGRPAALAEEPHSH